ncbi:polymorphic toxin-type HINT domain-containing protein [Streptomyces sp. ATE26]|uniref:polymorphic toxin-type HINT domain-containing protein n=1 Tax=Streptomyces sp. ATE26 TaxID=2954237 RepID=UPI002482361D|nr:polymorphic toxin-type HINT domain-containing protein [Streptomyces sp. ATE26]MDI1454401.1 polymorphic toxin-type HINT domain-containing protein [Streptomyces sp. ATE26]
MFGGLPRIRKRHLARTAVPIAAAALLVGLLPAQSLALPPDPAAAETGRETLDLADLERDLPIPGKAFSRRLDTLRADVPDDLLAAPAGTVTPPSGMHDSVSLGGSTASPAVARSASPTAAPAAFSPVGTLPVSLGQAPDQPAPSGTWQVTIPNRTDSVSQGVDGTVLLVQAPATGSVPISVKLDYSKFKSLYGADWASRLRFVQFPDCYWTTPDDEACQTYEELETTNDPASTSLTATVDPAADDAVTPANAPATDPKNPGVTQAAYRTSSPAVPAAAGGTAVVAAVDSGSGAGGSFAATPLASDGKWAAGGSSGGFSWSYPLSVPPAPAGPTPKISFEYSSQSVDGRTAVSSPQASWIGEGWSYDPGHIERRYRTCKDDRKALNAGTPNNTAKKDKTSDLCWVSYNAVMSLAGRTTELIRDAASGSKPETDTEIYRPQQDDGTRVEHRVGASNDDNNGEYWIVTTTDGTQYFYGQNRVGGGHADTNSVSTVPVFGNHPGEPCHADTFADSRCGAGKQQAWYWGLDKVVDVQGNTMVVNWKQETNYYAVKKKFKSPEQYDRNAYPTAIEYGMRSDLTKPSATIDFGATQRCLKSETACDAANFAKTDDPGAYRPWWDTPGNLNCKSTSKLCAPFPSFWTQMRLDTVTSKAARAGQSGLDPVDKYTLRQSFPEDWYDTAPGLWLNSITRTGYAPGDTTGTLQSTDGISFAHYTVGADSPLGNRLKDRQLPNLVLNGKNDPRPGFTRPRIGTISTENGGDIEVEYTGGCATTPAEDKGKANGTCYPVRWSPDGDEKTPAKAWFNKYVVDSVTENDKVTSHGRPVFTKYTYKDAAWAKSDDESTRPALRTYSDWRGYRQVTVVKGSKISSEEGVRQPQSYTVTRYFQGTGGAVKDSTGTYTLLADDAPQYAGMTAEAITYRDSDGKIFKQGLNFPWSKQTASRSRENEDGTAAEPLLAYRTGIKRTDEIQMVDSSWRSVRTLTTVDDTYGLPLEVETSVVKPNGSGETLSDQSCTKTSYVHNTTVWLIGLPKEQRTMATSCAGYDTADPATRLKGAERTSYDNLAYGATPTKGQVTSTAQNNAAGTGYDPAVTTTYDPLGRVRTITAPGLGTTEKQYTPADSGGPVTSVRSIDAMDHATVTTYDPGRELPLTTTDVNGRVERREYDALGRLVKGFSPSRSTGGKSPNVEISYQAAIATSKENRPASVTVKSLKDDGSYARQITLYDGLARPVQTQSEAHGPGRVVTDTTYNDHGLVDEVTSPYLAKGEPATDLFSPRSKSSIPSWTKHRYDGLEREVRASVYQDGDFKYATYTDYNDTSTWVNPPGSTTPTTLTSFDALGRVTSVKHYTTTDSSASTGRTTKYEYDARGNRNRVTDPAGNVWSFEYDARGRVIHATDPDTGTTDTWYDDADRPNHVRNARQQDTFTEYDVLGRILKVRQGSATAVPVKEYTYDSLPGAIGLPVSSTRHTANGDYINRVTGYDTEYRATGTETVIPANAMTTGLAGTYAYSYTYTPTGAQQSATLPAAGGLASERVVSRYTSDGLPESTSGKTWYTADATYSPYGEPLRTVSGSQPNRVWTTNFVDPHTGRLQRTVADRETSGPHRITDSYYSYDTSGTITSNARQMGDPADGSWDNQCYTYDALGELVHVWTSKTAPAGNGTGCKAANGSTWGYRTSYAASSGPVAEAPTNAADAASPNATLASTLAAAAPDTATVATGTTAYRQSFTFDWLGNRATHTDYDTADPTKNVTFTYGYGKTVTGNGTTPTYKTQPHTATWISSNPSGKGSAYTYDGSGNTTVRDLPNTTQDLVWTPENKLDTITDDGKKTTYVYDAAGNRILENSSSGSTLYLGETELTTNASGTITNASRSYSQPGAPTVVRTTTNGATTGHQLNVLITDNLGTANTTVQLSSTQSITRRAFKPYGELRGPKPSNWPNKRGYLGSGIDDTATGLTHLGAREYDQNSGRFLSADPIIDLADPLQMNGYAYSNNSPVSKSDPTGLILDAESGGTAPCTKAGGCVHDATDKHPSATWKDEGNAQLDYNGDGYISVYPTVKVRANWRKAPAFINAFYKLIDHLCDPYGRDGCADQSFPSNSLTVTNAKGAACRAVGRKCPAGLIYDKGAATADSFASAADGGEGPAGGLAFGGIHLPRKARGCNCFLAGTKVLLADKSSKDIEDIEAGDQVLATDPETGESGPHKVVRLIINDHDKHFNDLTIQTPAGERHLTATHEHPFWVPELGQWVWAGDLTAGMHLRRPDGSTVEVVGNRAYSARARTYNLTVEGLHTYYVLAGQTPVLVHNSGPCGPAKGAAGEARAVQELQDRGYTIMGTHVKLEAKDGTISYVDVVATRNGPGLGAPEYFEVKNGPSARLSPQQKTVYGQLGDSGNVILRSDQLSSWGLKSGDLLPQADVSVILYGGAKAW